MENLTLTRVLKNIELFGNEENSAKLEKFLSEIEVKPYLGILEKNEALFGLFVLKENLASSDSSNIGTYVEMARIFDLLFLYTNIEVSEEEKTYENYDKIVFSGLEDYILSKCEKDFLRLEKMFDRFISTENVFRVSSELKVLDPDQLKREREDLAKVFDTISPDLLQQISLVLLKQDETVAKNLKAQKEKIASDVKTNIKK